MYSDFDEPMSHFVNLNFHTKIRVTLLHTSNRPCQLLVKPQTMPSDGSSWRLHVVNDGLDDQRQNPIYISSSIQRCEDSYPNLILTF